jgi:hypothetical protein
LGYQAGGAGINTNSGTNNTAIGYNALASNNNTSHNIALGGNALYSQAFVSALATYNIAIGDSALFSNLPTGANFGTNNVAVGSSSLAANTVGINNIAIGTKSQQSNTIGTNNIAIGAGTLQHNITGADNVAIGSLALQSNTAGSNVAIGEDALFQNTNGSQNVAIGALSSLSGSSAANNTAVGYKTLYDNSTGDFNTVIGCNAAYTLSAGQSNVAVGSNAMEYADSASGNTAVGAQAMLSNSNAGFYNTAIGYGADEMAPGGFTNSTALGYLATITGNNQIVLGNAAITSLRCEATAIIPSDGRFKTDITENIPGLEFITRLRPVSYHFQARAYEKFIGRPEDKIAQQEDAYKKAEQVIHTGFIAQEVEKAAGDINFNFSGLHKPDNEHDTYGLAYSDFVMPLIKAVQQQQQQIEKQNARISQLEQIIEKLQSK